MKAILIILHCESNTGYAIGALERTFYQMAMALLDNDPSRIHFAYPSMARGKSRDLPPEFDQYLVLDTASTDPAVFEQAKTYLRQHGIDTIFAFDHPVHRPIYPHLRAAGLKHFITYWGAPMSSIFGPFKRLLKRIDVALHRHGPDHYIFESRGMAETAVLGRGISARKTSVVYLGVDVVKFHPDPAERNYVYEGCAIPAGRKIFFFSGHMERRKGVHVILGAAEHLAKLRPSQDWHILLLGNQAGEAEPLLAQVQSEEAKAHITFGGYRNDVNVLHRGCYAGIIASTGWDSLPRSSIEMQASGLPLLISNLPGLREAVESNVTGVLFPVGDAVALAQSMNALLDDDVRRNEMAAQARKRAETGFTLDIQLQNLIRVVREVCTR